MHGWLVKWMDGWMRARARARAVGLCFVSARLGRSGALPPSDVNENGKSQNKKELANATKKQQKEKRKAKGKAKGKAKVGSEALALNDAIVLFTFFSFAGSGWA